MADDRFDDGVTGRDRVGQGSAANLVQARAGNLQEVRRLSAIRGLSRRGRDRQPARHRLQTALQAAAAKRPVGDDLDVADFHARVRFAADDFPVVDAAAADSRARKDTHSASR